MTKQACATPLSKAADASLPIAPPPLARRGKTSARAPVSAACWLALRRWRRCWRKTPRPPRRAPAFHVLRLRSYASIVARDADDGSRSFR